MIKRIAIVFGLIAICSVGCKKYPDGPIFSLLTKKQRLTGVWEVQSFFMNGIDSSSYLQSQPIYGKFLFDSKAKDAGYYFGITGGSNGDNALGYWRFTDDKSGVFIHLDILFVNTNIGPFGANDITWEIRRLKNKELWLKNIYAGKEYLVKFKQ